MKRKLLMHYSLLVIAVLFAITHAQAQVSPLVSWEFSRLPTFLETDVEITSTATDMDVEQSTLTRGAGLGFSSLARAFGSISKTYLTIYGPLPVPNPVPLDMTTKEQAKAAGDYFQMTFQPKSGNTASLTAIDYRYRRSGAGARYYRWAYSKNGSEFTDIGPEDRSYLTSETDGIVQPSIDLAGISELQTLNSTDLVVFRLYLWGFTSQSGSAALGRYNSATNFTPSLAIRGVVTNPSKSNLLVWNFNIAKEGDKTDGKDEFVTATTVNPILDAPKLKRGDGITIPTSGFTSSINGIFHNWMASPSTATFETAQANNEYYEFAVSSGATDKFISLFNLNTRVRRTSGGAPNYRWTYSLDEGPFIPIDAELTVAPSDHGYALPTVDLTGIPALKNIPSTSKVTFRIYFWGAISAGGVTAIGGTSPYETDNNEFYNGLELQGLVTDAPLPVSLTSFTAKAQNSNVNLNWSTASETNNSHFEITRSTDGNIFDNIGTAKGNGTVNTVSNYKFTDLSPSLGANYYQLRQVDLNGKSSLSKIEAVKFSLNKRTFSAYTLQNESVVKLSVYTEEAEDVKVIISNMKGEAISTGSFKLVKGNNAFNLPIHSSPGVHVASLLSKNGNLSAKFIKE